jgi:quercetin dioxygenase-like cupin family protein
MISGYALPAGDGLGGDSALKASVAATGGSLTVIESDTTGGAPRHVHTREDEAMYVLEGGIVVHIGDEEHNVTSGGFVFMPRGLEHDWDVVGDRARVLIITAPGGLDAFLAAFHAAGDRDEQDGVAAAHGITFRR